MKPHNNYPKRGCFAECEQNWNGAKWLAPVGNDKPALNYVKVNAANNIFSWWALVDSNFTMQQNGNFTMQNIIADERSNVQTTSVLMKLEQNIPNPFSNSTTINYSIAKQFLSAKIIVTDKNGNALKQINFSSSIGNVVIDAATLSSGAYQYTLYVDGRLIASKQFIISK